ncbi:MAG: protein translocase subunit SecF [Pseudomonadales bacterium]|nr:protein translocase subunit SecF [Pseudomonadales bacterium]
MSTEKVMDFMGRRNLAMAFSIVLILVSIGSLAVRGLNFGLDFTGGTLIELGYEKSADLIDVRERLQASGFDGAVVQYFGSETDVMIRIQRGSTAELGNQIVAALQKGAEQKIDLRRIEFVGPQVGEELKEQGGMALLLALGMVMIYVALRFQMKFAIGSVAALAHDVIITLGFFSVFQWEFDLTVLAALLAVIGYSLNDTIVVSDRIRENFRLLRKGDAAYVINVSLTQTLSRTLVTSLTTLLVLVVLFFAGGEMIRGFSIALIIGVIVGTYSSIYVAANVLMMMHISKEDLIIQIVEENEEGEPLP